MKEEKKSGKLSHMRERCGKKLRGMKLQFVRCCRSNAPVRIECRGGNSITGGKGGKKCTRNCEIRTKGRKKGSLGREHNKRANLQKREIGTKKRKYPNQTNKKRRVGR